MGRRARGRRGPGLVGTMARTAVIAGTATAVSGNVAQKQHAKQQAAAQATAADQAAAESQQQIADMHAQLSAMQTQQTQTSVAAVGGDLMSQLQQLAQMKESGLLNDAQFEAAKAKLLGM